jgi:hydroxypyruvate isomerase
VDGLKDAVKLLEQAGVTLLVEPLNDVKDHPGYFLTSSEEGFKIINEVDSPKVLLLYDVYHQLHMGEDIMRQIKAHMPLIGHFHVAGFPGRDEQIHERFDYAVLFHMLQDGKIDIPVGIELFPTSAQAVGPLLESLKEYL